MPISKSEQALRLQAFFEVQWHHMGKFLYKNLDLHKAEATPVADIIVLTMTFTSPEPKEANEQAKDRGSKDRPAGSIQRGHG